MSLTSSPSPSGPDPKATVSLNGTRFPSHLFEDTSLSTKVSAGVVHCLLAFEGVTTGRAVSARADIFMTFSESISKCLEQTPFYV